MLAALALGSLTVLGGCGNTLQDQPVGSGLLEQLVIQREYPIYWLGAEFHHMAVTGLLRDPSEALTVQYGDCAEGGQSTCVTPLTLVSSPDNSFRALGSASSSPVAIRGVTGLLAEGGRTIEIPTADVVVDIYAKTPALAMAAARTMVAINQGGAPGSRLAAPLPSTDAETQPVAGQLPKPVASR